MTKKDILPVGLFLSAILLFLAHGILTGSVYYYRDITYIFHPWKTLVAQAIQSGKMPLWNPYAYCGMPLLANWQSAVFYPFSVLFNIFSFNSALKLFYFIQLFLAGLFAYLFGKKAGLGRWPSAGLMFAFVFNGYIITKLEFLSHFSSDIWTFALLLLSNSPPMLAAALSICFLAGHQVFFIQLFIVILWRFFNLRNGSFKADIPFIFLFAGLIAVQLLPTIELSSLAHRVTESIDYSIATLHSVPLKNLKFIVWPSVGALPFEKLTWYTAMHVGLSGFVLFIIGAKNRSKYRIWALSLVLLGLFLASGSYNPFYNFLYNHTFFLKVFRYPVQFFLLSVTGFSLLIGYGISGLKNRAVYAVILLTELSFFAFNSMPVAQAGYFNDKPSLALFLQKNLAGDRFILSPGTETNRLHKGKDLQDAWKNARNNMYGLACLPYRIQNAYGSGEPLVHKEIEKLINEAYRFPTPQEAIGAFNALGVRYLLTKNELPDNKGYILSFRDPLFVNEIRNFEGKAFLEPRSALKELSVKRASAEKIVFGVNTSGAAKFVYKETFFPGWELYINGRRSFAKKWKGVFMEWDIPEGTCTAYSLYRPASFFAGLMITVISLLIFVFFGIIKLNNIKIQRLKD